MLDGDSDAVASTVVDPSARRVETVLSCSCGGDFDVYIYYRTA